MTGDLPAEAPSASFAPLSEMPTLLALDTGGPTAGVGVFRGRLLAEIVWQAGRRESAQLLGAVEMALGLAGLEKSSVEAIAVASGPGAYSGLRVGFATATGLALGLGIGIVQVPTLEVLAWGAAHAPGTIRVAVPLGRNRFASARVRREPSEVAQESAIETMDLSALVDAAEREGLELVVDLDAAQRQQLEIRGHVRIPLSSAARATRRPGALGELADLRLRRGHLVPSLTVDPIYVTGAVAAP